jgi:hypothetical protein|tara:strand:- start:5484 stop:5615 length:132 start_codon:yes stop_codon:yes gene_type:complete
VDDAIVAPDRRAEHGTARERAVKRVLREYKISIVRDERRFLTK